MIIDPLDLIISWLRQQPELTAIAIGADLVGHTQGESAIVIEISPLSRRMVRDKMDRWELTFNYYGADKRTVAQLSGKAREILLERLPALHINGVTVTDVEESHAPYDFSDPTSNEQRYLHLVSLYCYK
jgi:hypothetical protein